MNQQPSNSIFFNTVQKTQYLHFAGPHYKAALTRLFSRANKSEQFYEKDLGDFNLMELDNLMYELAPGTKGAATQNFYNIRAYIRWAIEHEIRKDNINPLQAYKGAYADKFVMKKSLYTISDIEDMVAPVVNVQDYLPVYLLFEGAFGKEYAELSNLREEHVSFERNVLHLTDVDRERLLKVSERCISSIKKALSEKVYYNANGDPGLTTRRGPTLELPHNGYVMRATPREKDGNKAVDKSSILRRLRRVRDINDFHSLSATVIRYSGMLYEAKLFLEAFGKLNNEFYEMVSERFGIRSYNAKGGQVAGYYRHAREFLNEKTLFEVYGIKS